MKTQTVKSIIVFLLVFIFTLLKAKAQIVYTDINPDTTITTGNSYFKIKTYRLDLNNDGTEDFKIFTEHLHSYFSSAQWYYIKVTPLHINEVLDSLKGSVYYPVSLVLNSYVGADLVWRNDSNQILSATYYSGFWSNNTDAYLGLKLIVGSDIFYGWIRLSIQMNYYTITFTIKDYAYNSIPNQPILAGETSCATPTVTLSASGPLSFCAGDSVTLTANGTGYQYQWKKNGVNISGAKSKTYIAKTASTYKCKVTNSCGSKTSGGKTVTVPCRITNENFVETLEHLSVFPNPANNYVTIKFHFGEEGTVQIINLFGKILYSKNLQDFQNLEGLNETKIDVSKFSPGMYVVRWNSGENSETKFFSIVK